MRLRWLFLCALLAFGSVSVLPVCHASRVVKDQWGRSIPVPDHPSRIVCLVPSVVDDAYALGAGDAVVAVSDFTMYPKEATRKPSVGLPLTPSIEKILALHPDLVLGSGDSNQSETVHELERLHIPVFMVDPHGIAGVLDSLSLLGDALSHQEQAHKLIAALRFRAEAVRARAARQPQISVLVPLWYDPIISIGKHAFMTEVVESAGARSVTDDINQEWPQVSLESIIARAPQALILNRHSKISLNSLSSMAGWKDIPAVAARRVYYTDERIELPSPVMFDAMEDLAKQLHPQP